MEPTQKYAAEIELINTEEWRKDLRTLFQELAGLDSEIAYGSKGIADAKFRALYPEEVEGRLDNSFIDMLVKRNNVRDLLGSTRRVSSVK
jgi:hypothetical protein